MLSAPDTVPTGSATGNPRNKVALKKGRGLMDWVRLGHTANDLAGTKGKCLKVTPEQLAKHNKKDDAWLALKGNVYNVTPYFEYHPGGEDELMRGIGKDATDLFNEVHKWVNFQSMLQKCLVGTLVESRPFFSKPNFLPKISFPMRSTSPKKEDTTNTSISSGVEVDGKGVGLSSAPQAPGLPKYDWFQTKTMVDISIYTKCQDVDDGCRIFVVNEPPQSIKILVYMNDYVYVMHKRLTHEVERGLKVKTNNGKVDVMLSKVVQDQRWLSLGESLPGDSVLTPLKNREIEYVPMEIVGLNHITHNVILLKLEVPENMRFRVPLGFHVYLKPRGSDTGKPYTPLVSAFNPEDPDDENCLEIFFKVYPDGALTPLLQELSIGDDVDVSFPEGTFSPRHRRLATVEASHLVLLGAGTGITPLVRLLKESLKNRVPTKLLLFNRTEQDIPWKQEFDDLAAIEGYPFQVIQVLSSPSQSWTGLNGRIRKELLVDLLTDVVISPVLESEEELKQSKPFFCSCGPTKFTKLAIDLLKEMGFEEDQIFAFTG